MEAPPELSPVVMDRIFEPFSTTKPAGSGTGLGLSISHGIVRARGGDIRCGSRKGESTRVVIELPAAAGAASSRPPPGPAQGSRGAIT